MSWAERAKRIASVEGPVTTSYQTVHATAPEGVEVVAVPDIPEDLDYVDIPHTEKSVLVLDTNALLKGLDNLLEIADVLITVPQVLLEVRDRASRDFVDRLPITLLQRNPSEESVKLVLATATSTGDVSALSRTDIRVAALAYDCCRQLKCLARTIEPLAPKINPENHIVDATPVEEPAAEGEEEPVNEDEEGWITPENVKSVNEALEGPKFSDKCACVTSDFPMQNTLKHMGVPVVGPRGMMITQLRTYVLRCHACFHIEHDTLKQFCSDCGSGNTLKRVSYVLDENGNKKLFINFSKRISTRGTIFNLPKPRGGRKGTNRTLCLREDQLVGAGKVPDRLRHKYVASNGGTLDDDLGEFATGRSHHFDPNRPRLFSSYKRYNVNERKKAKAGTRK